jgi:four helix bundle protein
MKHNFHELKVWERAMDFVTEVYRLTQSFPKEELYGLTSQARRAATSIALNIAEGSGASSDAEFTRFLEMARRSVYEVMTALEIALRLGYCSQPKVTELVAEANEIAAMITGLVKHLAKEKASPKLTSPLYSVFCTLYSQLSACRKSSPSWTR